MNTNPHTTILIARITEAIRLAKISVYLGLFAIVCFAIFGTLASLAAFKDSTLIYLAFHYLPYVLIGLSIPISMYHVFLLHRYRIIDTGILLMILAVGVGLLIWTVSSYVFGGADTGFFMSLFLAMIAWFGMPFLFRVNLQKFLQFLQTQADNPPANTKENL